MHQGGVGGVIEEELSTVSARLERDMKLSVAVGFQKFIPMKVIFVFCCCLLFRQKKHPTSIIGDLYRVLCKNFTSRTVTPLLPNHKPIFEYQKLLLLPLVGALQNI